MGHFWALPPRGKWNPGRAPPRARARACAPGPRRDPLPPRDVGPRRGMRRDVLAGAPTMGGGRHVNAAPRRLAVGSEMLVIGIFLKFPEYWNSQETMFPL